MASRHTTNPEVPLVVQSTRGKAFTLALFLSVVSIL